MRDQNEATKKQENDRDQDKDRFGYVVNETIKGSNFKAQFGPKIRDTTRQFKNIARGYCELIGTSQLMPVQRVSKD